MIISNRFSKLCLLFLKNNQLKKSLVQRGIFWGGVSVPFQDKPVFIHPSCYRQNSLSSCLRKAAAESPGKWRVLHTKGPRYSGFSLEGGHTYTSTSGGVEGITRTISNQSRHTRLVRCAMEQCAGVPRTVRAVRFSFCWNSFKCEAIKGKSINVGRDRNYADSKWFYCRSIKLYKLQEMDANARVFVKPEKLM